MFDSPVKGKNHQDFFCSIPAAHARPFSGRMCGNHTLRNFTSASVQQNICDDRHKSKKIPRHFHTRLGATHPGDVLPDIGGGEQAFLPIMLRLNKNENTRYGTGM